MHFFLRYRDFFRSDEDFARHMQSHHDFIKQNIHEPISGQTVTKLIVDGVMESKSHKNNKIVLTKNHVYPFIVEYDLTTCGGKEAVVGSCHELMIKHSQHAFELGLGRYDILSSNFAIVTTTWTVLEETPFVKNFLVLHPDLKLSKEVLVWRMVDEAAVGANDTMDQRCLHDHGLPVGRKHPLPKGGIKLADKDLLNEYLYPKPTNNRSLERNRNLLRGSNQRINFGTTKEEKADVSHPFKLRIQLHTPSSVDAYEDFLLYVQQLEDNFNQKHSGNNGDASANTQLVIGEVIMNLDEAAGYSGARRQKAKQMILSEHGNHSAETKQLHGILSFETRSRAIPTLSALDKSYDANTDGMFSTATADEIFGELSIYDCSKVYEIAQSLAARPEVISVTRHYPVYSTNYWAQYTCDAGVFESASLLGKLFTGAGTASFSSSEIDVVGIADTGIDMYSLYFYDTDVPTISYQTSLSKTVLNRNHRKIMQYIAYADAGEDADGGHGSHVAGSVAGNLLHEDAVTYNGDVNAAKANGMSPDAKISFFDIGVSGEPYLYTPTDINKNLFSKMLPSGAKIFSNSWGSSTNYYETDARNSDLFMWQHPETLVVVAAGNDGEYGINTVGSPATGKNILAVGAGMSDADSWDSVYGFDLGTYYDIDSVAYFSSIGPTADGRLKPDVIAPGYWVMSAYGTDDSISPYVDTLLNAGTSMATPIVSSFVLKVRRYFLDGYYPTGIATAANSFMPSGALMKAVIIHSGHQMKYSYNSSTSQWQDMTYPSIIQGYGRLMLNNTLKFSPSTTYASNFSSGIGENTYTEEATVNPYEHDLFVVGNVYNNYKKQGLAPQRYVFNSVNTVHKFYLRANDSSSLPMRFTMAYTDYPGTAYASNVMTNTLKLSVDETSSTGNKTYTPYTTKGTKTSLVNNVQMIDISSPVGGALYTIKVTATKLQVSNQTYALVVTGAFTEESSPSAAPTTSPTRIPSKSPTARPTITPSRVPTFTPSATPTAFPTLSPSAIPTAAPMIIPSVIPTSGPSVTPSAIPTAAATITPSAIPTAVPSITSSIIPTAAPSIISSTVPTAATTIFSSNIPTAGPSVTPSAIPTAAPIIIPSAISTASPSITSSAIPTAAPTIILSDPNITPSLVPSGNPMVSPSEVPTANPVVSLSIMPSADSTFVPSSDPTVSPSAILSSESTFSPSLISSASSALEGVQETNTVITIVSVVGGVFVAGLGCAAAYWFFSNKIVIQIVSVSD
jgi:hypothetical protein